MEGTRNLFSFLTGWGPPALPGLVCFRGLREAGQCSGNRDFGTEEGQSGMGDPPPTSEPSNLWLAMKYTKGVFSEKTHLKLSIPCLPITPAGSVIILEQILLGTSKLFPFLFPHFSKMEQEPATRILCTKGFSIIMFIYKE